MKKKHGLTLLFALITAVFIGIITFNLDKIMRGIWEFRDGLVGLPRRRY